MLKITKGLKKKKKGKKSKKNKEEELFKPEELEAYRREHQQAATSESVPATENDEWKKFQQLTAGVDNILRKTQGDLDRIKSTSFFQRVPLQSEVAKAEQLEAAAAHLEAEKHKAEQQAEEESAKAAGIVLVSETESDTDADEQDDDIFDTSFVDAVASGQVKLAYIPESPTLAEGDDPFDTSIAERAILGPAFATKGKKLVPLGAAVEVLTGRVEQVSCVRRPTSRRPLKQQDLLLESFDFDTNGNTTTAAAAIDVEQHEQRNIKSLLDLDDESLPSLDNIPIDLSGATLYQSPIQQPLISNQLDTTKQFIAEFDLIDQPSLAHGDDEDDDEFALLAVESLSKTKTVTSSVNQQQLSEKPSATWNNFQAEFDAEEQEEDPFDTTFADNILPGKAELKLIEHEILYSDIINEFPLTVDEKYAEIIKSQVTIHLTNPTGERESISSLDRIDESCLTSLQPVHRDLLGGSNTDLSNLGDDPIQPQVPTVEDSISDYSDPFDTSIVDKATVPGQAELKFIENEILGPVTRTVSDPDFNPRGEETDEGGSITEEEYCGKHRASRPDLLDVNSVKSVAFALPTPTSQPDLLVTGEEEIVKHSKPLTPYYVRENSIPESHQSLALEDPFDTSFVPELAPGKAELKLIESEFIDQKTNIKEVQPSIILSDEDFDPRAAEITTVSPQQPKPDLLAVEDDVSVKVLTPAVEIAASNFDLSYSDPFDTSIASNILPGKTELKLIENELIHTQIIKRTLTDPEFDPRNAIVGEPATAQHLLDNTTAYEQIITVKPLIPLTQRVSFDIGGDYEEDIDPFDTSVADNLVPGRTELKLIESELI